MFMISKRENMKSLVLVSRAMYHTELFYLLLTVETEILDTTILSMIQMRTNALSLEYLLSSALDFGVV